MIPHQNLSTAGRNLGYEDLEPPTKNLTFNYLENSVVQLVAFSDVGVSRINDRMTLKNKSVLKQFDECMSFYRKHINTGEIIESAYRKTIEGVPFIAYREAKRGNNLDLKRKKEY